MGGELVWDDDRKFKKIRSLFRNKMFTYFVYSRSRKVVGGVCSRPPGLLLIVRRDYKTRGANVYCRYKKNITNYKQGYINFIQHKI